MPSVSGCRSGRWPTVLLCALAPSALLLAAQDKDPDFSLADTVQVGPFHMAPFFSVKDFGYDGNTRLGAGDSTSDYTITMGPGARAVAPLGRLAAVSVWEQIDYSIFAKQSDLNHVNNSLRTKVHAYLRDFTVYADGEQLSSRDRPNNEIDYRIRTTTTQGKLGFNWNPGRRGTVDLFARSTRFDYDAGRPDVPDGSDQDSTEQAEENGENIADSLQRFETTAGLSGALKFRPRTSALLDLRDSRIDFEDDDIDPNGDAHDRDSEARSVMGGLEFDPAGSLRGYLKVGVKHLEPVDHKLASYDGIIADASLSARLLGRGELRAGYQRDTAFSTFGDNLFFLNDRKSLSYEHYMNSRLSIELGRQLDNASYPTKVQLFGPHSQQCVNDDTRFECSPQRRDDDIVLDKVTFRYRIGPALRVGLSVGHWERDSNFDTEDASRPTIATLLEYTP